MSVSRKTSADITISSLTVEQDITTITDPGNYVLNVDVNNLANGETLVINEYIKVRSGGTERLHESYIISHAQTKKAFSTLPIGIVDHLRYTLTQSGGSVRTFPTSVYQLDA